MPPKSDPLLAAPKPTPVRPCYACLALPMGNSTLATTRRKVIQMFFVAVRKVVGICEFLW
jgi:hypothetical protein